MSRLGRRFAWTTVFIVAGAAACGDDEDPDGAGGAAGSDAGDGASGSGASGGSGGSTGGSGGSQTGGAAGIAGAPGGASGAGGCTASEKTCGTDCRSTSDPAYGCAATDCAPCPSQNGTPSCDTNGACALACITGFSDCDQEPGCELPTGTDSQNCGGCGVTCTTGCVASVCQCGNGTIDSGEECDDGNTLNADGCDSTCHYEVVLRMTALSVVGGGAPSPSYCVPSTNQFGSVWPAGVVGLINNTLKTSIDNAVINVLLQLLELDDLTGTNDADFDVALLTGTRDPRAPSAWTVGQIDYWFLANPNALDASGLPKSVITTASVTDRSVAIGPAELVFPFGGSLLELQDGHIRATVADSPAPDVPAPPPSALASGLSVLRQLTTALSDEGMCGNITVASLAQIPLPATFAKGSALAACIPESRYGECRDRTTGEPKVPTTPSNEYIWCGQQCGQPGDADFNPDSCAGCDPSRCSNKPVREDCNSLLDAIVGGCVVNPPDCVMAFAPTQPDVAASGDTPATLVVDAANGNKVTVVEPNDAYSGYFKLTANRTHITNNLP